MSNDISWISGSWIETLQQRGILLDYETMMQIWQVFDDRLEWLPYLIIAAEGTDTAEAIKWIVGPLAAAGRPDKMLNALRLREFIIALTAEMFPRHFAKEIFDRVLHGEGIEAIIADPKYAPIDRTLIDMAVAAVIAANTEKTVEAKANPKLLQWFVGQVLKANKGMNPLLVKEALEKQIRDYCSYERDDFVDAEANPDKKTPSSSG